MAHRAHRAHPARMQTKPRPANVKWFSAKAKRGKRRRSSPRQIVAFRLADFAKLFRARYRGALPDDDAGRDDIPPVLDHLAALPQASRHCDQWLDLWAPWLSRSESRELIAAAIIRPRIWTADQLAWRYRVTREEREWIGLTTIGAIDQGKAARTKRRRERARQRKRQERQSAGTTPRATYEAASAARQRPWEAAGVSRATWYRQRRRDRETSPATP